MKVEANKTESFETEHLKTDQKGKRSPSGLSSIQKDTISSAQTQGAEPHLPNAGSKICSQTLNLDGDVKELPSQLNVSSEEKTHETVPAETPSKKHKSDKKHTEKGHKGYSASKPHHKKNSHKLPKIKKHHKKIIEGLYNEVDIIRNVNVLNIVSVGRRVYNIVSGKSELRDNFVTLKTEVHLLSCLLDLRRDAKQWPKLVDLYHNKFPGLGSLIRNEIVDCFTKYHAIWKPHMNKEQMKLFCRKAKICTQRGSQALERGEMKQVIEMMIGKQ